MGEGLSPKFAGQASVRWSVHLSCLLIVSDACGLREGVGGTPLPWYAQGYLEVTIERVRGISGGINKFKINNCQLTWVYCRRKGGG